MTTFTYDAQGFTVKASAPSTDRVFEVSSDGTLIFDSVLTSLGTGAAVTYTSSEAYLTVQSPAGTTFYIPLYKNHS